MTRPWERAIRPDTRTSHPGNSLTYTNNLPQTVADLGEATGDTIRVLEVALPNFAARRG